MMWMKFAVVQAVLYLLVAFVAWDFSWPGGLSMLSNHDRAMSAVLWFLLTVFGHLVLHDWWEDE